MTRKVPYRVELNVYCGALIPAPIIAGAEEEMNTRVFAELLCVTVACAVPAPMMASNIAEIDIFKNQVFTQTSGVAPTTPADFFADIELNSVSPGNFNAVSVAYPVGIFARITCAPISL